MKMILKKIGQRGNAPLDYLSTFFGPLLSIVNPIQFLTFDCLLSYIIVVREFILVV